MFSLGAKLLYALNPGMKEAGQEAVVNKAKEVKANAVQMGRDVKEFVDNPRKALTFPKVDLNNLPSGPLNKEEGINMAMDMLQVTPGLKMGSALMGVIKPKGGNWLPEAPKKRLVYADNPAIQHFTEKKYEPYIKNKLATPEDPVRIALEEGKEPFVKDPTMDSARNHYEYIRDEGPEDIDIMQRARAEQGFPPQGFAAGTTRQAEAYEYLTDEDIGIIPVKKLKQIREEILQERDRATEGMLDNIGHWRFGTDPHRRAISRAVYPDEFKANKSQIDSFLDKIKWIDKVDDNTPVYYRQGEGFSHDIKETLKHGLDSGAIDPADVFSGKITIEDVLNYGDKVNKKAANKANSLKKYQLNGNPDVVAKGKKFHFKELKHPGEFAIESDYMSHSVRGYEPTPGMEEFVPGLTKGGSEMYGAYGNGWLDIKEGRTKVFSLRDNKTLKPVATVELEGTHSGNWRVAQARGPNNQPLREDQQRAVDNFVKYFQEKGPRANPAKPLYEQTAYEVIDEQEVRMLGGELNPFRPVRERGERLFFDEGDEDIPF